MAARLETRVKRNGKWSREVVYLISSLTLEELQARGLLRIKRGYWVVESRLHHCLDLTMREDQSRVRTARAAHVLGTVRRVVLSLANAAVDRARAKNPKIKYYTKDFQERFNQADGGKERLRALIFAKSPNIFDF